MFMLARSCESSFRMAALEAIDPSSLPGVASDGRHAGLQSACVLTQLDRMAAAFAKPPSDPQAPLAAEVLAPFDDAKLPKKLCLEVSVDHVNLLLKTLMGTCERAFSDRVPSVQGQRHHKRTPSR